MRTVINRVRRLETAVLVRVGEARRDDRGEINSNIAWTGAMVLLAVTLVGILAAKATSFANGIDFGG
jgi:hypothetical protein